MHSDEGPRRCQAILGWPISPWETVNRFCHGSLIIMLLDLENGRVPTIIFGTSSGIIGAIVSLPTKQYAFFEKMQHIMRIRIEAVAGLSHED